MWHPKAGDGLERPLPLESATKTQAVLEHLATGCLECGGALTWLLQRGLYGRRSQSAGPPEHTVAAVKEAFSIPRHRRLQLVRLGWWGSVDQRTAGTGE